jgi:hypothetical protein
MSEIFNVTARLWHTTLQELGFTSAGESQLYTHPGPPVAPAEKDPLVFTVKSGWGILQGEWQPRENTLLNDQLGQPGLWKIRSDDIASETQAIFEVPPTLLAVADPRSQGEEGAWLLRDTLAWGLATAAGQVPADWEPPAGHLIDAFLPQAQLTLQVGPTLRQITVVCEPDRLALTCTLLPQLPNDLSPARNHWLDALLRDGNNRWRMVRIGVATNNSVLAEVDLTGIPASAVDPLLKTALEALHYAVKGTVQAADFLADGSVNCRALEILHREASPDDQAIIRADSQAKGGEA